MSDVKVLSTPSVVVLDNQVATLQVGDQVPVATASATVLTGTGAPVVNTIDYRNTGVILRVVPRINANGNVLLDVEQEISNVAAGSAGSLTPTVSQRRVKSSIAVASGQTVLLAGLISERNDKARTGLPIIDQLPTRRSLGQHDQGQDAHRADHLHPAADHPRRRRFDAHRRGDAHQAARADRHQRSALHAEIG